MTVAELAPLEKKVIEKLRELPEEKRQEVIDFAEFLGARAAVNGSRRSLMGAYEHLGVHVTEEDIAEVRREMWGNFPRDID